MIVNLPDRRARFALILAGAASLLASACAGGAAAPALRIGAIFPLSGSAEAGAAEEFAGARLAADMVNAGGGVAGRRVAFDVRDAETAASVQTAADSLHRDGVAAVVGAYSSQLSIPAAAAVAHDGMVYWESGAVADQVTGQGSPLVFRVGADGADLGGNSGQFVTRVLAPRLHREPSDLSAYLVTALDDYGRSVADGVRTALSAGGVRIDGESRYDPFNPIWAPVLGAIAQNHPDLLVLSSHIPDGIAFRRAFLAAHLHVDAFIGTTMAQCRSDFGDALGADAVGVFASDRPEGGFNAGALGPAARSLYDRFAAAWHDRSGEAPGEEALSGFTSTWVLLHDVLPHAHGVNAGAIAAAARGLDMPYGTLPNGGGVRFGSAGDRFGQNERAIAVVWQWQAIRHSVVVYPPAYATGTVKLVPLPA
ncbi:MAG: amino acid ABC transporter substrate-binding protein [Chloroflexi bacterium]|nr:MAG: amino acid ABC transporter substrate-binding protein [Chloroflexota bacterium]